MADYVENTEGYIELLDYLIDFAKESADDVEGALDVAFLIAHRDVAKTILESLKEG